jgi:methyl-accepting chemotaxis protein WspA
MLSLTISRRLALGFALIIVTSLGTGSYVFHRLRSVEQRAMSLHDDSLAKVILTEKMKACALNAAFVAIHMVLETNAIHRAEMLTQLQLSREKAETVFKDYGAKPSTPRVRELFETARSTHTSFYAMLDRVANAMRSGRHEEGARILDDEIHSVHNAYLAAIEKLLEHDEALGETDAAAIEKLVGQTTIALAVGGLVGLVIAILVAITTTQAVRTPVLRVKEVLEQIREGNFTLRLKEFRRDEIGTIADGLNTTSDNLCRLVGQVQQSGIQINTAITQMAATLREQQATSSEVASTTIEIGATAKEITATSNELVKNIGDVARVAEQTSQSALSAQDRLTRMDATMRQIIDASAGISAKLSLLNEKAGNINSVVTTINKVADQTNLLSLNAAIEAEKAGEHGRGFAVVATETRRLADQTAVATYDIEQMVKEMQSAVSAGVMGMDKFNEEVRKGTAEVGQITGQLGDIIQQVTALTPRFEAVNESMQTQAAGSQQITEALGQLSETAQQTAEALRQSNQAVEQLSSASRGLKDGISRFKVAA